MVCCQWKAPLKIVLRFKASGSNVNNDSHFYSEHFDLKKNIEIKVFNH